MRYHVLACDYDGTLARHNRVESAHVQALEQLAKSGRKLVLLTGRELPDLLQVFPRVDLFDAIVTENGALLYRPGTRSVQRLADAPAKSLITALQERDVRPLSIGSSVIATWHPHEQVVLDEIRNLGLELDIVFNRDAVMILPSGVNKYTGLSSALKEMGFSTHNTVGIGDAENDHVFLAHCECAVAVANAIPAVKEKSDYVTKGQDGAGVVELVSKILDNDLADLEPMLERHHILLGQSEDLKEVGFSPYGTTMLVCGTSGSGKSTLSTAIVERLAQQGYQFCLVDPEGDYECIEEAVQIGDAKYPPSIHEIMQLLERPEQNAIVNLLAVPLAERPIFFASLLPRLQEMRARTGRPNWIILDETHHLLPDSWEDAAQSIPQDLHSAIFVTVYPARVAKSVLKSINTVLVVGDRPDQTIDSFCRSIKEPMPPVPSRDLEQGKLIAWFKGQDPVIVKGAPGKSIHRRHLRKYAAGDLRPDQSFYFRGPHGKLNLRAFNLISFIRILDGIDDDTWLYHLHRCDYSRWFKLTIKDERLAEETQSIEHNSSLSANDTKAKIKSLILDRYCERA